MKPETPQDILQKLGLPMPPPPIVPLHGVPSANEPIQLYEGPVAVGIGDKEVLIAGTVAWEWHPHPRVMVRGTTAASLRVDVRDATISIPSLAMRGTCLLSVGMSFEHDSGPSYSVRALMHDPFCGGDLGKAVALRAYLPNFPEMIGSPVARVVGESLEVQRVRITLNGDPWQVVLDQVPQATTNRNALRSTGGFAVTHVCEIRRVDGQHFEQADVEQLEADLHLYFSFLRGHYCSPVLLEGVDSTGASCWRSWSYRPMESAKTVWEWLPVFEPAAARQLFPGFMARRADSQWRQSIEAAVRWYLSGNTFAGGRAGAIVLAIAGLELLAWEYLADPRLKKQRGQSRQGTSEKVRALLQWAGIPAAIPAGLTALAAACPGHDAARALIDVRNGIAHPEPRYAHLRSDEVLWDSWRLALELLELAILRLSDYSGKFHSRVEGNRFAADVTSVPWMVGSETQPSPDGAES
ncbi:MAG: hypothetical protein U0704_15750 [Candidatus Eisenbacteria bacterium]